MSGLTLLLPHGYEGQGPEHSSARIERYLQLCAERNMWVCNLTTPANYFHALRRQLKRNFRKPLVIFTPKSLLRHKLAVSPLAEMGEGSASASSFRRSTRSPPPEEVRRVVLCTGKVYYDLLTERREKGDRRRGIVRLEQLYPFPENTLGRDAGAVPQRRSRLVPGRAGEHGRLELRRSAIREGAEELEAKRARRLCRPRGSRQPSDRFGTRPCGAAGRAGRRTASGSGA